MTSSPIPGHQPWGQESWSESWPARVPIWTFEKLAYKTLSQCDGKADDRGDCNSSPCTSYRWAKNWLTAEFQNFCLQGLLWGFVNFVLLRKVKTSAVTIMTLQTRFYYDLEASTALLQLLLRFMALWPKIPSSGMGVKFGSLFRELLSNF